MGIAHSAHLVYGFILDEERITDLAQAFGVSVDQEKLDGDYVDYDDIVDTILADGQEGVLYTERVGYLPVGNYLSGDIPFILILTIGPAFSVGSYQGYLESVDIDTSPITSKQNTLITELYEKCGKTGTRTGWHLGLTVS